VMPKSNQMNKITKNFRYDINALRAIAVLGVVFFHFNVQYFEGGFSGVDIFFVISGYLMTKIVINGLATDKFSILDFYYKRVQRIVPALMGLILIVVSVTFFFYLPVDYREVTKNGTASLLFYSNILYANRDYFDASSDNNIFLHTWSLSVEWQFYLLLPIILYLLNKIFKNDKRKFLIVFISVTALIFMFSAYMSICLQGPGKC
jgi:peptidoglycan/LPS O-acetylase OafA/YrhL